MASSSSSSPSPSRSPSKLSGGSSKSCAPDDANRGKPQPWEWKSVKAHRNPKDDLGFGRSSSAKSPRDEASSRSWDGMEEDKDKKGEAPNSSSLMSLNLGKRTYEEQKGVVAAAANPPASAAPASTTTTTTTPAAPASSTPPKKGRGCAQSSVVPKCQVEGCQADLSSSKDYHRRHKVCEVHSKTPKNTVNGQEQRFCQQCSRFHLLAEFDEGKRSCRRRLQGHNERRRKPQPDTLAAYNMGNASFQAAYQRLGMGSSIIVDSHNDHALAYGPASWGRLGREQFLSKQLMENLSPEKLLLLLQNSKRPTGLPTISTSSSSSSAAASSTTASSMAKQQQDHMKLSLSSSSGVGGGGGGGGGLSPVLDSGRALSLLSSDTWAKSPASYELSPGPSLQAASPATHASSQYILAANSIGGDGGSLSPKAQAHQAHQYHNHHHHHHHQGFQPQDAIPITTSGNSSKQQQQHQHQEQSYSSPLGMNRF